MTDTDNPDSDASYADCRCDMGEDVDWVDNQQFDGEREFCEGTCECGLTYYKYADAEIHREDGTVEQPPRHEWL